MSDTSRFESFLAWLSGTSAAAPEAEVEVEVEVEPEVAEPGPEEPTDSQVNAPGDIVDELDEVTPEVEVGVDGPIEVETPEQTIENLKTIITEREATIAALNAQLSDYTSAGAPVETEVDRMLRPREVDNQDELDDLASYAEKYN